MVDLPFFRPRLAVSQSQLSGIDLIERGHDNFSPIKLWASLEQFRGSLPLGCRAEARAPVHA